MKLKKGMIFLSFLSLLVTPLSQAQEITLTNKNQDGFDVNVDLTGSTQEYDLWVTSDLASYEKITPPVDFSGQRSSIRRSYVDSHGQSEFFSLVRRGINPNFPIVATPDLCHFVRDLWMGSTGSDVSDLNHFLENKGFLIPPDDFDYTMFGEETRDSLILYQDSVGIIGSPGFFGPISRSVANDECRSKDTRILFVKEDEGNPVSQDLLVYTDQVSDFHHVLSGKLEVTENTSGVLLMLLPVSILTHQNTFNRVVHDVKLELRKGSQVIGVINDYSLLRGDTYFAKVVFDIEQEVPISAGEAISFDLYISFKESHVDSYSTGLRILATVHSSDNRVDSITDITAQALPHTVVAEGSFQGASMYLHVSGLRPSWVRDDSTSSCVSSSGQPCGSFSLKLDINPFGSDAYIPRDPRVSLDLTVVNTVTGEVVYTSGDETDEIIGFISDNDIVGENFYFRDQSSGELQFVYFFIPDEPGTYHVIVNSINFRKTPDGPLITEEILPRGWKLRSLVID